MTNTRNFLGGLFGKKHADDAARDQQTATVDAQPTEGSAPDAPAAKGFFQRLAAGLSRSSQKLSDGVSAIFTKKKLDAETLSDLEELLIGADLGVAGAASATAALAKDRFEREITDAEVKEALADHIAGLLKDREKPLAIDRSRDATVGQNALSQADAFRDIAGVTGLVMTKLDGTARGGVLVALAARHPLPIHFIGVGEGVGDLQPFDAKAFARALMGIERF